MTFDEFKKLVQIETADAMHAELSSKKVQEALAMDDAKDVIESGWRNCNMRQCDGQTRDQTLRHGVFAAATAWLS